MVLHGAAAQEKLRSDVGVALPVCGVLSYAIYRIAETLRVLIFVTLTILVFNFYPVTAVMIVILALINDGAIRSIAYDTYTARTGPKPRTCARSSASPPCWAAPIAPIAAFGLFYLGPVFHLGHPQLKTLMYLTPSSPDT